MLRMGVNYMKYIKLLKQTFIGYYLTEDEIKTGLNNFDLNIKHFDQGKWLHLEGDECLYLEILLIGDIVSLQIDECGNERIINIFQSNEIIAGNILFGTSPKYPLFRYLGS